MKSLILLFLLGANEPLLEDSKPNIITDESKCNHPALQIKGFKLFSYMADYKTDFAYSKYWKELPDGKVQQVTVTRSNCEAPWQFFKLEIINPLGEKL